MLTMESPITTIDFIELLETKFNQACERSYIKEDFKQGYIDALLDLMGELSSNVNHSV